MCELRSALDELAGFDLEELSDDALLDPVGELSTDVNRAVAVLTRATRAADRREAYRRDGALSMKSWLHGNCRMAPAEATAIVSTGRRLEQLPVTAAAFESGEISALHARVITRAITPGRVAKAADAGIELAETDGILADLARETAPDEAARGVARWVAGVDPDGALDDAADVRRRFSMASGLDGRVHLRGEMNAVGGEYLQTALAALMNGDRPVGDGRSYAERQADALVALARGALDAGGLPTVRGERPHIRVTIDLMALCAERGAVGSSGGSLGWAGPINLETARRLACDAGISRTLTGPSGLPLDVGREQRTSTAAIRRAIEVRDEHCVFAGCDAPPEWSDVHHVVHWAHGGPTSCDNGALLCEQHHTSCHEGGFSIRRDSGTGRWHTYRLDGTRSSPAGGLILRGPIRRAGMADHGLLQRLEGVLIELVQRHAGTLLRRDLGVSIGVGHAAGHDRSRTCLNGARDRAGSAAVTAAREASPAAGCHEAEGENPLRFCRCRAAC